MAALVEWYTHAFQVSPDSIRVFNDLSVSGTCETEEKESGKEKYVSLKNRKPAEITLTAILDARLGCDVRNEVMTYINEAQKGTSDYIYANGGKLIGCKMMLTSAKASKIEIAPMGKWAYAQVALTFKQATKEDGSTSSSSSGGGGSSGSGSSGGGSSGGSKKTTSLKLISTVQDMVEVNSVFADAAVAKVKQAAVEYANSQAAKDAAKAALISNANKIINPATTLKSLASSFSSKTTSSSSKSSSSSSSKSSSAATKVSSVSSVVKKVSSAASNKVVLMKK